MSFSDGPIIGVPLVVWHCVHPRDSNSIRPASSGGIVFVQSFVSSSHFWNSSIVCTTTLVSIVECRCPQYSAQYTSNSPVSVALNHSRLYRPGTTSFFTRNAGMKKLWITSSELVTSRTGVFTGTCSFPSLLMYRPSYAKPQLHIRPVTPT